MTFSRALSELRAGKLIRRTAWASRRQYLKISVTSEHSRRGLPYIYYYNHKESRLIWVPRQVDILSDDWVVINR